MIEVPMTQGKVALIDDEDLPLVQGHTWISCGKGYAGMKVGRKTIMMHRFLLGPPPGVEVDHVNHNRLDNRRSNLRLCTHLQNAWNGVHRRHAACRFKGVYQVRRRYRAVVTLNRRKMHLGYFGDPVSAALAYDTAAQQYFGEFAYLNFPEEAG